MKGNDYHKSVLPIEAIDLLQVKIGKRYIDATLGGGGHAQRILESGGIVLGIDMDYEAIRYVKDKVQDPNLKLAQGNFKDMKKIAELHGFGKVAGILYDLGVSGHQLEDESRGFSFQKNGPLDMRMDTSIPVTASDLVNLLTKDELQEIFSKFGEEHRARSVSSAIVKTRKVKAIKTTEELLKIIEEVYGIKEEVSGKERAGVAKRVFQALRIAVNGELENLRESLSQAVELLENHGRLVVISFHSMEDRIVKESLLSFQKKDLGLILTKKPITPSLEEIDANVRSRSAKARVFERIVN
ncbi:MAG TPA: 16S rRNA (cytosine(1402)-N(4))-methyltransferase RsmH [Patescibacteria group bacterium]|nr:16S rRNA (cytosine(1402)-N(4))-methyltransferase RsmH [Patescibacteria group bacterium]